MNTPMLNTLPLAATSPNPSRTTHSLPHGRAAMLADALAWAVRHELPLSDALDTLPYYRYGRRRGKPRSRLWPHVTDVVLPGRNRVFIADHAWSNSLDDLKAALDRGERLSVALSTCFGRALPGYFVLGVAKAEEDGSLETTFPLLAAQMNQPGWASNQITTSLVLAAYRLIAAWLVLSFLATSIMPRYEEIFLDFGGEGLGLAWYTVQSSAQWAAALLFPVIGLGTALYVVWRFTSLGDFVVAYTPGLRRMRKRVLLADLCRAMRAFMLEGSDLLTAARWSRAATRSDWMKRRIDCFLEGLQQGTYWVDAWQEMKLGDDLDHFILRNAGAREDAASGFEQLAEWLHYQNLHAVRKIEIWLDPVVTLLTAVLVGMICVTVFRVLASIMYAVT